MLAYIQFAGPAIAGVDGYYHIQLANLIREHGISPEFPWLPFTILNPEGYTDHHFLLHLLQSVFTSVFEDLSVAAKWSAVTFAAFAFACFGWALNRHGVSYPLLWVALLLAVSEPFLFRMSMPRGQSLSLAFQLVFIVFLFEKRWIAVSICTMLFVLAYNAFAIVLPIAGIAAVAIFITQRRVEWRLALAVVIGLLAGLALHPNFPENLLFTWQHIVPKIFSSSYTEGIGNEWKPYSTHDLAVNSTLALASVLLGLLLVKPETLRHRTRLLFWLILSIFYLMLMMKSRRFAEYFPPVALFFLAVAMQHRWGNLSMPFRGRVANAVPVLAIGLAIVFFAGNNVQEVRNRIADGGPVDTYREASAWLASNTEPLETVMQTDWDDFPRLFFHNTHNSYFVGLDPDYLRLQDEELFHLWREVVTGKRDALSELLARTGARFVVTDHKHGRFIRRTDRNPCFSRVYEDAHAIVFKDGCTIREAGTSQSTSRESLSSYSSIRS